MNITISTTKILITVLKLKDTKLLMTPKKSDVAPWCWGGEHVVGRTNRWIELQIHKFWCSSLKKRKSLDDSLNLPEVFAGINSMAPPDGGINLHLSTIVWPSELQTYSSLHYLHHYYTQTILTKYLKVPNNNHCNVLLCRTHSDVSCKKRPKIPKNEPTLVHILPSSLVMRGLREERPSI